MILGRGDMVEEVLFKAGSLGDLSQYRYCLHYEKEWFLPLAERLARQDPRMSPLSKAGRGEGPHLPSENRSAPVVLPSPEDCLLDLEVHAFGPFQVVANGWIVPLDRCRSKKALTLLRFLFMKRHEGGVSMDEALELLWPEMDPRMTRSNLRVILSMLRKVFKRPETAEKGFPNLNRDGNRLSLKLGKTGWTDVDEFLNQINLAGYKEKMSHWEEALGHYEKVLELYRGDFLSEELYSDWCFMEREQLRDRYLKSLIGISGCYEKLGMYEEAIGSVYRLLKTDVYREDAYRRLMVLCSRAGWKGEIRKVYGMCRKAIEGDLNLELSRDTVDLFAKISSSSIKSPHRSHSGVEGKKNGIGIRMSRG
jgi:DNA-binding SARP family transcriptional activator